MVPPWAPSFASAGGTLSARGEVSELAEGARLEIACVPKRCVEGSNPSLSAFYARKSHDFRAEPVFSEWPPLAAPAMSVAAAI